MLEQQVGRDHYDFKRYAHEARFVSYYHQLKVVLGFNPSTVLEVGAGDKVFGSYIKNNSDIEYKNLDIAGDLSPDIVGSVDKMPVPDESFDVVCAFEILEHLPFEKFEASLQEMKRVSKHAVVLSLPHFGPPVKILFKLPFLPEIKVHFKIPFPKAHTWNGQHYWEIGKRGYSTRYIRKILKKHFRIEKEFVPFESQYHHFYVLSKK